MDIIGWKQFLIAGGHVSLLEWKSLSEIEKAELAQAGRILRAEQIVAKVLASADEDYLKDLLQVSEEFSDKEEENQAFVTLSVARSLLNARKLASSKEPTS